jgi:hypothetical protein
MSHSATAGPKSPPDRVVLSRAKFEAFLAADREHDAAVAEALANRDLDLARMRLAVIRLRARLRAYRRGPLSHRERALERDTMVEQGLSQGWSEEAIHAWIMRESPELLAGRRRGRKRTQDQPRMSPAEMMGSYRRRRRGAG